MVLKFHGGVRIESKKLFAENDIKNINTCSAACISAGEEYEINAKSGDRVLRGALLGFSDGTPVYASISGIFNGVLEIEGNLYFVVIGDGTDEDAPALSPEERSLTDLTKEDIITAAKQLAIIDPRSGRPLWRLLSEVGDCRRVVIDCTEPFPHSSILNRLCIEKAKEMVFGGKILVHAVNALKCVFPLEHSKKDALRALGEYATDEKLFASATLEEKYPYTDRALMYALYVKNLDDDETPAQNGILIVGAEAAIALYEGMLYGRPHTYRYITLCGEGMEQGGNFRVPRGITFHDLADICKGFPKDRLLIENSLLCGSPVSGALKDTTIAIIPDEKKQKRRTNCISCGSCAKACPVRLNPAEILIGKSELITKKCISCGACEYICPSSIPLLRLIKGEEDVNE